MATKKNIPASAPKRNATSDNVASKNTAKISTPTPPPVLSNIVFEKQFWKNNWLPAAILFGLAVALYAYSIGFEYVLDDQIVVQNNQFVKKGFGGIGDILFTDSFQGYFGEKKDLVVGARYRPLSIIMFAVETQIFGLSPWVGHFMNILLYGLTALLLFRVLSLIFPKSGEKMWFMGVAFVASLLFVAHPVHSEVVANIKGRDEILTLLGALLTLYYTLRYVAQGSLKWLVASGVTFFLALLAKENALTFLAVVPLTLYVFTNSGGRKIVRSTLPLLVATVLYLLLRRSVIGYFLSNGKEITDIMNNPFYGLTFEQKFATIFFTLGDYLRLLVFPHPLTHDYYAYHVPIMYWKDWAASLSLVIYLLLGAFALWGLRRKNVFAYGILFYLATLSIVSNIPFTVGTFMNERFIYVSSIGFCIILAYFFCDLLPKLMGSQQRVNPASVVLLSVFLLGFSYKTWVRVPAWKDTVSLNSSAIQVSKNSARANLFMATALFDNDYKKAIDPALQKEAIQKARDYVKRSIEILPNYGSALHMYSGILAEEYKLDNDSEKLLQGFEMLLSKRPLLTVTDKKTNGVFIDQYLEYMNGKPETAIRLLAFYDKIGKMLLAKKDYTNALRYLNYGLKMSPAMPNLNQTAAAVYTAMGNPSKAQECMSRIGAVK